MVRQRGTVHYVCANRFIRAIAFGVVFAIPGWLAGRLLEWIAPQWSVSTATGFALGGALTGIVVGVLGLRGAMNATGDVYDSDEGDRN